MVNDNDYHEGFRQGYKAVKGSDVSLPFMPVAPIALAGRTAFQTGILDGVERAKGWARGKLRSG